MSDVIDPGAFRLTQYARGGGCACTIPPGKLEETGGRLMPEMTGTDLHAGGGHGDDGTVVRTGPAAAVVVTADFFTPVVAGELPGAPVIGELVPRRAGALIIR